uniref:Uncharacterized protein n=1 Tax=Mizugakiibacter sediminis TaxID=1475481 RepID=A0A0S6YYA0_9GAMM
MQHFHPHGHVAPDDLVALVRDAGLRVIESGPLGFRNLRFVLAERTVAPVAPWTGTYDPCHGAPRGRAWVRLRAAAGGIGG